MSWFTENPWPLILILGGITVILLILGDSKGKVIAALFALIAAGVYFLEQSIVTPAEQIEKRLEVMLDAFKAEDLTIISQQIDDESAHLRDTARRGLDLVDLHESFHMQDVVVRVADDQQSATVDLRANGSMTVSSANMPHHAATRWRTQWKRRGDEWKLTEVKRLNIVNGEEMGILDPQ